MSKDRREINRAFFTRAFGPRCYGGSMDSSNFENDRRKHKRYKISDVAFAVLKSEMNEDLGQITNISRGGLAFEYFVGSRKMEKASFLDIMLIKNEFYIHQIPVRTIADFNISNELPFSTITKRRQSVCFESLDEVQEKQIDYLIRFHSEPTG